MPDNEWSSRVAIVTGGCSGIGRAAAMQFAKLGVKVTVADFQVSETVVDELADYGIATVSCDVRVCAELDSLVNQVAQTHGRLDIMVNNAGVGMVKPTTEVTEADWNKCLDTNLKAVFFGSQLAIRQMQLQEHGGAIINTASNAGLLPRAHDPVYSISKMAVVGLTKSLALCHAKDRIRVNCVCPGPVSDTGMVNADLAAAADALALAQKFIDASPLAKANSRMMTPDEVAASIVYLASNAAMMVTGTAVAIDGGKSLGIAN